MSRGETRTIAVRLPVDDYRALKRAYEDSDHKLMSDLLRAIVHDWVGPWRNDD